MRQLRYIWYLMLFSGMISSCNLPRYLPEGENLYTGAKLKMDSVKLAGTIVDELNGTIRPKPNGQILGMYPKLMINSNLEKSTKKKGFFYNLKKKYAEKPILLSQVSIPDNRKRLENILFARGYLQAKVVHRIDTSKRKGSIEYLLHPGTRYTVRNLVYPRDSSLLTRKILDDSANNLIRTGSYFDFDVFKAERNRIDARLKDSGFYFFIPEYIYFKVDSLHKGWVDLYMTYVPEMPASATRQYTISSVSVYGNYTLERDSIIRQQAGRKTKEFTVIDKQERYRTDLYRRTVLLREGQIYSKSLQNISIERLMNLQNFRFVRSVFVPDSAGMQSLASRFYLTPAKKRTLRLEISGESKSNNFVGSTLALRYKNLNLFRGAEILEARIGGGYDFQIGGKQQNASAYTINGDLSLFVPKLLPVFTIRTRRNPFVPRTSFTLGAEYIRRPEQYTLRSFKFSAGYQWKLGRSVEHNLRVLNINSITPTDITPYFDSILNQDPALKASFEKQLIIGSKYQFIFNNTHRNNARFTYIADLQAATSGNLATLIARADVDTPGAKQIGGVPISQFVKGVADLRAYWKLNSRTTWVNRFLVGAVFSYGNSLIAPYNEQFFIGGSSSLRAFRLRTLGPGGYHTEESVLQANEAGEFKLEMNTEIRYNLWKFINVAGFVDAGNIWYFKEAPNKPGSGLDGDLFTEMAMGAGLGLRFDFSILALRFDLAIPLRKPWLGDGERWVIDKIDFGNKTWRKENLILNIGIGYPF